MSAHPEDLASVTAANRDRLMGVAAAISTITNSERQMNDLSDLEGKARAPDVSALQERVQVLEEALSQADCHIRDLVAMLELFKDQWPGYDYDHVITIAHYDATEFLSAREALGGSNE